ncbi:MAG: hypothetical protein J2P53_13555 [Bradyrhizobiaceae bacterium]|nr:hypothetical protein [Bradyrhizobiaceae bacterium]
MFSRSRVALVLAVAPAILCVVPDGAVAQTRPADRATIWNLKLGAPINEQPAPDAFRAFACGSNGGAPRAPLEGFDGFRRCPAEPDGLHEVYFEYDDELEYIARAHDDERAISRWAGTHEVTFPVIVSALFDDAGMLRGIRMVTDARPEHRNDITEAERKKREEAYTLASVMASRFGIDPAHDCKAIPPADGETPVGALLIKRVCERSDGDRRIVIRASLFRKPGQSGHNPQLPTQLTQGQFESSARVEIYQAYW